jgi:hypothetical protein
LDLLQADPALVERARTELRKRINSIRGTHPVANEPYVVSAVSGTGVQDLVFGVYHELKSYREQINQGPKKTMLPDDQNIRS